ncbi:DUF397 domain-containing protein [Streptomyces prasinopilosus]|uniref:DUF397 domain-containing protein n=1 Tax=Streptomyces prasinopilosus TaxID=67344 RepID=A0A1G6VXT2_9ACTN|nr:DUF397 domain-containing protein [Streptomyces prasinopilosus]SDD58344.1 protein of unknown function [Streptomyces prasinopilosus]
MTDRVMFNAAIAAGWRRSSYSNSEGGSCLEVLDGHRQGVPVRDSKNPHGPTVIVPASAWSTFVTAVRSGGFPS